MQKDLPSISDAETVSWRRLFWAATLVAASIAFSFGFACAVPLAGFAAVAALTTVLVNKLT